MAGKAVFSKTAKKFGAPAAKAYLYGKPDNTKENIMDIQSFFGEKKASVVSSEESAEKASDKVKFTDIDRQSVANYTGNGYYDLNEALRGENPSKDTLREAKYISRSIAKLPKWEARFIAALS